MRDLDRSAAAPLEADGAAWADSPAEMAADADAAVRYGAREWSPNVIRRLEEAVGTSILAQGFPAEMRDDEPEAPGREVIVARG